MQYSHRRVQGRSGAASAREPVRSVGQTTVTDDLRPALTESEWARLADAQRAIDAGQSLRYDPRHAMVSMAFTADRFDAVMAIANAARTDAGKITPEDIEHLRRLADFTGTLDADSDTMLGIAAKLAAILPPREHR